MMQNNYSDTHLNPNSDLNELYSELVHLNAKVIVFCQDDIFLDATENAILPLTIIPEDIWKNNLKCHITLFHEPLYALNCTEKDKLSACSMMPLKKYLQGQPLELKCLLLRAKQLLFWHKNSLFCGACGHKTKYHETHSKICLGCSRILFPTVAPAVIVLIARGHEILLARSTDFRPGVYSNLAGFIEAGESAEQAIEREVQEEVGITVKNIRYFGSQSWPFENSFMIGYFAEYESGEICLNPHELEDARWFPLDALPELPYTSSIARRLIDYYINKIFKS